MTTPTRAQIEAALAAYDKTFESGDPVNRARRAMSNALTAAAEVGEPHKTHSVDFLGGVAEGTFAERERCAQVAENWPEGKVEIPTSTQAGIAAAIRKPKDVSHDR